MRSNCVRLTEPIDPIEVGIRSGLMWSRNGVALAGVGEAARLAVGRPDGAAEAQDRLREFAGGDECGIPGSGPVAFGAFPFDRTATGELVVPQVVVGANAQGDNWITTIGPDAGPGLDLVRELCSAPRTNPQPTDFRLTSVVPPEHWRDQVVTGVRDRIRAGEFAKVVLARELRLVTDKPIDLAAVLTRLYQNFSTAIVFAVDGFVGASPELLVSRFDNIVRAHPLAGTAPRSSDPERDAELAAALEASTKDQFEHRITIDWLLDNLLPYCSYVDAEPEPAIFTLPNVHHLGTRVEGLLSQPAASVLELVSTLHPTPAVGGDPQQAALEAIDQVEPGDRGRYAGPVGWVDAEGNGEFAVGVRTATIDGDSASIWAGVGVVADSDPEAELAETRAKFQAMLGALLRP